MREEWGRYKGGKDDSWLMCKRVSLEILIHVRSTDWVLKKSDIDYIPLGISP